MLNYIIWNVKPQIIDLGSFELRYYSLMFALAFVLGYIIIQKFLKKENLNVELLDKLTVFVVLSTIIGARLGHCLFYEFDYYSKHPLEIILPWRGTLGEDFRFTGYQGLASHGGALGILIGIYLFKRKTKTSYFWTLDRLAIVVALAAFLIRTGNLMNSEIYGNPTKTENGFVFAHDFSRLITARTDNQMIEDIVYKKSSEDSIKVENAVPINLSIIFSDKIKDENVIKMFAERYLKSALTDTSYQNNIVHPQPFKAGYSINKQNRNFVLSMTVFGVPRYPTQIYEALSYLLIFFLLIGIYYRKGDKVKNGFYLGLLLILVFTARFFIEFVKENQEQFENTMALNMGQILSIPFVFAGFVLIWLSFKKELKF